MRAASGTEDTLEKDQPSKRFGKIFLGRQALEKEKEAAAAEMEVKANAGPDEKETARIRFEIAEKKLEIFWREHDNTDAWKTDRMWKDVANDLRARPWERDADGLFETTESDKKSFLLLVNMAELDRLNKIGGHELGDDGLCLAKKRIEEAVQEVLSSQPKYKDESRLAEAYDIYRYSGNDFAVNLRDVDESLAEEINQRINRELVEISELKPGAEPVELTCNYVSRAEGLDLLNDLEVEPESVGRSSQKTLIEAMLEKVQTLNDVGKVLMRTRRITRKLLEAKEGTENEAKELYDRFLKKSLGDVFKIDPQTDLLDFDGFKALIVEKGGLADNPSVEWKRFVTERALESAFASLKGRRALGHKIELDLARMVARDFLQKDEQFGRELTGESEPVSMAGFTAPEATRGRVFLFGLEEKFKEAKGQAPAEDLEKARLDLQAVSLNLEQAKRDLRTGLFDRAVFFETMEAALERGEPLTAVALDMAFLKYFDKEGGPTTGDLAIAKGVELLDKVAAEFSREGVKVEAYRIGGDEFAFTIIGGDNATAQKIVRNLRERTDSSGRVPAGAGARESYKPEKITFNFGTMSVMDVESFKAELQQAGITLAQDGARETMNEVAGYLLKLADKELEIQKSVDRLQMFVNRIIEEKQGRGTSSSEALKAYSDKAIFGAAGKLKLAEWADRLDKTDNVEVELGKIKGESLEFVLQQLDAQNIQVGRFELHFERKLEDAVRLRYFESRINELENEIFDLQSRLIKEKESRANLENALAAAEEERKAIVNLREGIRS
ncbi:GGDEF domain-containing protein [Patescibacteria group bacterium]|nr:GGDEF domain-containing protein [Patescibacteria group bacterium]